MRSIQGNKKKKKKKQAELLSGSSSPNTKKQEHYEQYDSFLGLYIKVGVNPSLKRKMWLTMHLITKKTRTKMYKSIHFWNQKNQMNPMVATDFCKIMRFF